MAQPSPNATLYVKNLNEKIKIPNLEELLRETFGEFGKILEVVAKRNIRGRGQAFIVFESVEEAELALESLDGFPLGGKDMVVQYAKTRSDATVKREDGEDAAETQKATRIERKHQADDEKAAARAEQLAREKNPPPGSKRNATTADLSADRTNKSAKPGPGPDRPTKPSRPGAGGALQGVPDEYLPPNKTLVIREFPEGYTQADVKAVFDGFAGFKEARLVSQYRIAFAEFKELEQAIAAKEATNGRMSGSRMMRVTYQKPGA